MTCPRKETCEREVDEWLLRYMCLSPIMFRVCRTYEEQMVEAVQKVEAIDPDFPKKKPREWLKEVTASGTV